MINSRKIEDLHPYVAYLCRRLIEECKKQSIDILVTSTLRDDEYQNTLYQQGRTKPGSIVTNLQQVGAHGFGLAFDFVPLINGKAAWNTIELFNKVGKIGQSLGLEWGGSWKKFIDRPHMQYVQGLSTSQLRVGKRPKFPPIPQFKPINNNGKDGMDIMNYNLKPICQGRLKGTGGLECCSQPSNSARTGVILKKIHEPFNIYTKVYNEEEGNYWYLVNKNLNCIQWVATGYVEFI